MYYFFFIFSVNKESNKKSKIYTCRPKCVRRCMVQTPLREISYVPRALYGQTLYALGIHVFIFIKLVLQKKDTNTRDLRRETIGIKKQNSIQHSTRTVQYRLQFN